MTAPLPSERGSQNLLWPVVALGLGVGFVWAYWPTITRLIERWETDPQASHGFLIPFVAAFLLWYRRDLFPSESAYASWWGVGILAFAGALRLFAGYLYMEWFDQISLVIALVGCWVLVGGWPALRWGWRALVYLLFMIPLPFALQVAVSAPLQRLATLSSTYTLQTLGYPALAEGNVIVVDDIRIGVLEACNGLGMLLAFFAISAALAFLSGRPLWERIFLFLSAIPTAVLVNLIRITLTAIATLQLNDPEIFARFHDVAGWLMMPFALLLLWMEQKFLSLLYHKQEEEIPLPLYLPNDHPAEPGAVPPAWSKADPASHTVPPAVSRRG